MKKVLIATTNKDKYTTVSNIFKKSIFPESKYQISCLTKDMNIPDEKEEGSNIERARVKAINAYDHLKEYGFDYIVGLDDALVIKGKLEPNIKNFINKILYENYLEDGEEFAFNRAYCIINKEKKLYEVALSIPEIYHPLNGEYELEAYTYPLSRVSYPVGYDVSVIELSSEEITNYNLKYVKEGLMDLNIK